MQLAKYSKYKDKVYTTVATGEGGNNSTTSSATDRNLWGNDDTGNDMNGSMRVQGNIYVMGETWTEDENGEPIPTSRAGEASSRAGDDPFPPSADDGVGNLFLDGTVYAEGVATKGDITAGRHLYINYPHPDHTGGKKCVGELIKSNADAISSLTTKVNTNTTNISNNADEISKLKASNLTVDDVLKLIRDNQPSKLGAYDQPVVLLSGVLERNPMSTTNWLYAVHHLPHFDIDYPQISGGLMTIDLKVEVGYEVNVCAIHATQYHSGDTTDAVDNPTVNGRNDGAHWFECRRDSGVNTKKIYIREFHQKDGNNDSWGSDWWGGNGGGIQKINITLIGHITPPSS